MSRATLAPKPFTAASVITLLNAIDRHVLGASAAIAFRSALRRKGIEADAAGGLQALDTLMDEVADADPDRADARTALLRSAWTDLLPATAGRTRT
ncbi:hypothetical protein Q8W71_32575 [Methylobacterium sp. NEAU 140]|uniref:hypothetical protein n=1 Tax=Methylobacterium sp. NEAU 140 TaxID=3064945 RepID=UPI0027337059|nr:hypothetical protein [Methylobacterium sp. NEAU 140]MDP4027299.1 hypothetical protein [Methylobacterium sp. NEAU 140]